MSNLEELAGHKLTWTQPNAMVRYHELRGEGGLYATLRWKKMFGSLAIGESKEGRFTFKRAGFLRPYITVRRGNLDSNLAVMRFTSGSVMVNTVTGASGTLEFQNGERFAFHRLSFWKSRWAFVDRDGNPVVTFDKKRTGKPKAEVLINGDFRRIPYIHILLVLGWYAIILDYEEGEAAVGTNMQT